MSINLWVENTGNIVYIINYIDQKVGWLKKRGEIKMSYAERKVKYEALSRKRNRPLIVYVTSIRTNLSANMAGDAISPIIDQVDLISEEIKEVDFMNHQ